MQCLSRLWLCDDELHCMDGSDEICQLFSRRQLTYPPPKVVLFQTITDPYPKYKTMKDTITCPETHFQCPVNGYCLPVYVRCNGVNDCPGREDEAGCDSYTCPGFYRCRGSTVCLHAKHVCDTQVQCPQHDDEQFCELTCPQEFCELNCPQEICELICPSECTCFGWSFVCGQPFSPQKHVELRYLDASNSRMSLRSLAKNTMLIHLSLARCDVTNLGNVTMPNLRSLDLSDNHLRAVRVSDFRSMSNLQALILRRNPITSLFERGCAVQQHLNLETIDMSHVLIEQLYPERLSFAPNLRVLNLSECGIQRIHERGFQSLKRLSRLDISGCPVSDFPLDLFTGLDRLTTVHSDNYRICCASVFPQSVNAHQCKSQPDAISTCEDLIGPKAYRVVLSVMAAVSLLSNVVSFGLRVVLRPGRQQSAFTVLITHLSVADALMGLHLAIVLLADIAYRGHYVSQEHQWRSSAACHVAGFVVTLSSVVSSLVLCLLTLLCVAMMYGRSYALLEGSRSAHALCAAVWITGTVLALMPVLPGAPRSGEYSQSSLCRPLPISNSGGGAKAHGFLELFSLVVSLLLVAGYVAIHVHQLTKRGEEVAGSQDDDGPARSAAIQGATTARVGRQVTKLVCLNFLCRLLVGLLAVEPVLEWPVPSGINVAVAVTVLPLSSALNPCVYWLATAAEHGRRERRQRLLKRLQAETKNRQT